jgi:hypothetical protein
MYTIGTSSLRYLREKTKADAAVYAALDKRLLAFVGTELEMLGDGTTAHPATLIAPYSSYFMFTNPPANTQVTLYIPYDPLDPTNLWPLTPTTWKAIGQPFNQEFITESLTPAGGLANGLYATQRGNFEDMHLAFQYPGLTYYAKDTKEMYVYADDILGWLPVSLSSVDKDPMGSMVTYPEQLVLTPVIEASWMRCDGHVMTAAEITKYHAFSELIKGKFTSDPTECKLPTQNNMIIRVTA